MKKSKNLTIQEFNNLTIQLSNDLHKRDSI
jgi:hypothetical protein